MRWGIGHFRVDGDSGPRDSSFGMIAIRHRRKGPKGKKEEVTDKDEVPEFIEKKIKLA